MPDVLLIQPPIRDFYLTRKRTIPYGLACLAAVLIRDGFTVDIFDALATAKSRPIALPKEMAYLKAFFGSVDRSPFGLFHHYKHFGYAFDHIGKTARDSGAFLVGISSLFTPYVQEALKTAETVRKYHPGCRIVLGGHHPTAMPESVMSHGAVDFVLRGEAEVSIGLLAKALQSGTSPASIPGIVARDGHGGYRIGAPAVMDRLDAYPLPAAHLIDHRYYKRKKRASAMAVTSRGCPMQCTYCSVNASGYAGYRQKPVDAVISEIDRAVKRFHAGFIDFEDENLSLDRTWFLRLLHNIECHRPGMRLELRAMNGLLPSTLDAEVVAAMARAGFKTLNLALGTTSKAQLVRFKRPDVRDAFDRALNLAEKNGLDAVGYVIAGGPYQQAADSIEDLLFLARRRVLCGMSIFYPSPGSAEYQRCQRLNILPDSLSLMRSTAFPISYTTTREETVTLLRLSRILNFIKSLIDQQQAIPEARVPGKAVAFPDDRTATGRQLLQWFFYDGIIRGVSADGSAYAHQTATALTGRFIKGLDLSSIKGVHCSASI